MDNKQLLSLIGRWVGSQKIINIEVVERKTYLGNEVLKIGFDNKENREIPTEILLSIATEEISDLTTLREKTIIEPLKKIQAICLDAELYLDDVKFLLNVSFENWINGMLTQITIQDINSTLEKKFKKDGGK